jgi:hypothetical protein
MLRNIAPAPLLARAPASRQPRFIVRRMPRIGTARIGVALLVQARHAS